MSKAQDKSDPLKWVRIKRSSVMRKMSECLEIVASHLDFEGIAVLRAVRTGPQDFIIVDDTVHATVGAKRRGRWGKYSPKRIKEFWTRPAMQTAPDNPVYAFFITRIMSNGKDDRYEYWSRKEGDWVHTRYEATAFKKKARAEAVSMVPAVKALGEGGYYDVRVERLEYHRPGNLE